MQKYKDLIEFYRKTLKDNQDEKIIHLLDMMDRIDFNHERKAMRWIGFIQGTLWTMGIYSIPELKSHNRS